MCVLGFKIEHVIDSTQMANENTLMPDVNGPNVQFSWFECSVIYMHSVLQLFSSTAINILQKCVNEVFVEGVNVIPPFTEYTLHVV